VLWAYDGWYAVNCTAEEVESPGRTIPRALVFGTAAVLFLYLAANIVYSLALPMNRLRGLVRVGEAAASNIFGPAVAPIFAAIVALTIFGCLSANILFCARVPFAMARDGSFVGALGVVSDRTGTPSRALAAQMVLASALALTGTYQSLIQYVIFALVLFFAATGLALVFLRAKAPRAERPYRVRPYPLLPLAFILCNLAVFAALVLEEPRQALIGTALILSGIPAYFVWGRKRPAPAVPGEGI
jgi:amino acid transporter